MSRCYVEEQSNVTAWIRDLKTELELSGSKSVMMDSFIAIVRKYTIAKKLTPRMISGLINRVEISVKEYLEKPFIIMQTRKGEAASCALS